MSITEYIGFIAGFCTTISFLPQVIKIYQTRSTESISLSMYIIFSIGLVLWITYGFLINSEAVIASNSFILLFSIIIIIMKLKWK